MYKLFKMLNIKSLSEDKKIIMFSLFSFVLSISLLGIIVLFKANTQGYIKERAKFLNHGDLAVHIFTLWDDVYKRNSKFEEYLNDNSFKFTTEDYSIPSNGSTCHTENKKSVKNVLIRFIDYKDINYYSDTTKDINPDDAILSEIMAKKLGVTIGDYFYVTLKARFQYGTTKFKVGEIIDTNEINIDGANFGYIMLDKSSKPKIIPRDIANRVLGSVLNDEDYNYVQQMVGKTAFYIDASDEEIKKITEYVNKNYEYIYKEGEIERIIPLTSFSAKKDLVESLKNLNNVVDIVLALFTFFSLIISSLGLISLLNFRVIKRQKEIAVLKIYGLNRKAGMLLNMLELLFFAFPAFIFGILLSFILFKNLSLELTGISPDYLNAHLMCVVFLKLLFMSLLIILSNCVPVVSFINALNPVEVIRNQQFTANTLGSIFNWVSINILVYIIIFFILFQDLTSFRIVIAGIAIIILIDIISKFALGFVRLLKTKSYFKLCINYIIRYNSNVRISIVTLTTCLIIVFLVITINFRMYDIVTSSIIKDKNYNISVQIPNSLKNSFVEFLEKINTDSYYHMRVIQTPNESDPYTFLEFVNDKNNARPYLEKGVSITGSGSKKESETFIINNKVYTFDITKIEKAGIFDTYQNFVLINEGIIPTNADEQDLVLDYYIKAKNKDEAIINLNNFASDNIGVLVIDPSDLLISQLSFITGYKNLFNILVLFFLFVTFIVVLNSILIATNSRITEFSIYTVYGATKPIIGKLMLFESILICIVASVGVCIINIVIIIIIYRYIFINFDALTLFVILFVGELLTSSVSVIAMKNIKFKELINILRF